MKIAKHRRKYYSTILSQIIRIIPNLEKEIYERDELCEFIFHDANIANTPIDSFLLYIKQYTKNYLNFSKLSGKNYISISNIC